MLRGNRISFAVIVVGLLMLVGIMVKGSPKAPSYHPVSIPATTSTTSAKVAWPTHPQVLFFGDSWTAGVGAAPSQSWASDAGRTLGVPYAVNGVTTTGYLNPGHSAGAYPARMTSALAASLKITPNVVVLQGGLNDAGLADRNPTGMRAAIKQTISETRTLFPGALVVMVGPMNPHGGPSAALDTVNSILGDEAAAEHVAYLDALAEDWFPVANVGSWLNAAVGHPNAAGYAGIAKRFLADVKG